VKESASSFNKGRLRPLTGEEIELWLAVAKTVSPRPSSVLPQAPASKPPVEPEAEPPAPPQPAGGSGRQSRQLAAGRPKTPPLAPLERRLRQKLARGRISPDAAIDLHGLRRQEAFVALHRFLSKAQREGAKLALVVTGKGGRGSLERDPFDHEAAGVLRRSVPQWLRGPEYHSIVVGFEEASRPHGGAGALYVRIRGRRPI
jgi:DNA-nicking Smr family endonuclease